VPASMTGQGSAEARVRVGRVLVRLRSVNSRSLRVSWRVAEALRPYLPAVETLLRGALSRGSVEFEAEMETNESAWRIDKALLDRYAELARRIGGRDPDGAVLLSLPGVVVRDADRESRLRKPFLAAARRALAALLAARKREGRRVTGVLRAELDALRRNVGEFEKRYKGVARRVARRLAARLKNVLSETHIDTDDASTMREVALLAQRADVSEEVERLKIHIKEARRLLRLAGPVGVRMDFVAQEMNREVSTLAAKCAEPALALLVLDMRTGVARLREQVQNLE